MPTVDTWTCGHCQNQNTFVKKPHPHLGQSHLGHRAAKPLGIRCKWSALQRVFLSLIERAAAQDGKVARGVILLVGRHPLGTKRPVASAKRSLWPSERRLLTGKFAQRQGLRELTLRSRSHPPVRYNPADHNVTSERRPYISLPLSPATVRTPIRKPD